ncbi:unnamed protein product [Rhodiola kirilowii]
MPKLVKLKYLKLCANWDTDLVFYRIIKFINACPLLETFALEIYDEDQIPSPLLSKREVRKQKRRAERKSCDSLKCLKVLELYGGDGITLDQEIVKCIIRKAPNLEKLMVSLSSSSITMLYTYKSEIVEVVEAKAKKLCQESPSRIDITVVGCCKDAS